MTWSTHFCDFRTYRNCMQLWLRWACAVSSPLLLAYTKYGKWWRLRPNFRPVVPLLSNHGHQSSYFSVKWNGNKFMRGTSYNAEAGLDLCKEQCVLLFCYQRGVSKIRECYSTGQWDKNCMLPAANLFEAFAVLWNQCWRVCNVCIFRSWCKFSA